MSWESFEKKKPWYQQQYQQAVAAFRKKKTQWFEEDLIIIGMNLFAGLQIKISYFWLSVSK